MAASPCGIARLTNERDVGKVTGGVESDSAQSVGSWISTTSLCRGGIGFAMRVALRTSRGIRVARAVLSTKVICRSNRSSNSSNSIRRRRRNSRCPSRRHLLKCASQHSVVSRAIPVPASDDMTNVAEALREIPGWKSKDPLLTPGKDWL